MRNTTVTIVALDIVWIGYTACQEGGLKVVPLKLPPTRLAAGIITVKGRTLIHWPSCSSRAPATPQVRSVLRRQFENEGDPIVELSRSLRSIWVTSASGT